MTTATAVQVIGPVRAAVAALVATTGVPTYQWLPDDVAHLPCHVVGRPRVERSGTTPGLLTAELNVSLLGRRVGDDDAQAELDALGDQLFATLGATSFVQCGEFWLRCERFEPDTVFVAGVEIPAYVADLFTDNLPGPC
jgi:hypothetical protein